MELGIKKTDLLTTKLERFNFSDPPVDPTEIATKLLRVMMSHSGIGLAANQCGLDYRFFVMKSSPNIACFNPLIVDVSSDEVLMEEGCLSFPNLIIKIKRPEVIKLRYQTPNGEVTTQVFNGITARIVQHELDHLDGILFYTRANLFHRQRAFKNKKILDRRAKKALTLA